MGMAKYAVSFCVISRRGGVINVFSNINSSRFWSAQVVGDDSFSVFSFDGEPLRAHAVRRPKGQDLLRVKQTTSLPRLEPQDNQA